MGWWSNFPVKGTNRTHESMRGGGMGESESHACLIHSGVCKRLELPPDLLKRPRHLQHQRRSISAAASWIRRHGFGAHSLPTAAAAHACTRA